MNLILSPTNHNPGKKITSVDNSILYWSWNFSLVG